ncbi:hypothetical protein [Aureimonas leprariae]|nr:hypothetical protein [Aureimonas leprariae]
MIGRLVLALSAANMLVVSANAEVGKRYLNARFVYGITIPAGFGPIREADNGDGGHSISKLGHADLAVWGSNIMEGSFQDEAATRRTDDERDGWRIVYSRNAPDFAVLSGTRGERIVYQRAIPACPEQVAFFRLEYDASAKQAMDPVIRGLTKSFKRVQGCDR